MRPSGLDPERWRQIDDVLDAALETPPDDRAAFLERACGDDDDLRSEVESLLVAHRRAEQSFERSPSPLGAMLATPFEVLPENRLVGPFRLLREIGRGGMGVVYLAEDTRLGRYVALKALPPYLGVGPEAKQRFAAEARAVSALDHPNIATLYEIDETEAGQLYMAFAYYEGETLDARIARGPLPVDEAAGIATRIAAGLAAAHAGGIIHRDVKPSNVLLTEGGEVKLLDFGVAKAVGEEVTREGVRLGTVAYMSPEQASGAPVDVRSDLWSLGVVMYEMLTGERPFRGDDHSSLIQSILQTDPEPPAVHRSELPEAVERVVGKLLSKEPDDRYPSAEDLLLDLRAIGAGESPSVAFEPPPASRARGRIVRDKGWIRRWIRRPVPAVLLGLVLVAGGTWLFSKPSGTAGPSIERLAVLPLDNLTGDPGQQPFVDGVHEALIGELGKIGTIDVISRTSTLRYRETQMSIPAIADELDVDALIEGSVLREGDSVAISTQLVVASPERQLWAGSYHRGAGRVFEIAGDVARAIASEIQIAPTPEVQRGLPTARAVDPEAYDAFTLGQFNLERRSREGLGLALKYFQRAIEIDSSFAPAYAALAEAYGSAVFFGLRRPASDIPRVRALAQKAVAIDGTLADAHTVLGAVRLYGDWDWDGAEESLRRAIALNPSYAPAHLHLSEVLSVKGRYGDALESVKRGSELERFVPFSAFRPAVVLNYARDFDGAIEQARSGLEFFTDFWQGHWLLCLSLSGKGLYGEAVAACEEAVGRSGRTPLALGALGFAFALDGRRQEAKRVVGELEERAESQYVGASSVAMVYGALGDNDRAFEWLDRAYLERDVQLVHLADYVFFDPLRSDPRFDDLLQKVGIEP
jgi:TolB-like protein